MEVRLLSLSLFFVCSLSWFSLSKSILTGNDTDRLALLAFKHQIAPGPLSSWNETNHFCEWKGVSCGQKHPQRVTAVDLSSQGLTGSISPSIGNLTFLRTLLLASNGFYGEIPLDICRLSRLQRLNLSTNSLHGTIPMNLSFASDLRIIDLNSNQLAGRIPVELGSLSRLEMLGFSNNSITGAIPPTLGNLSSLIQLSLGENHLEGRIPEGLGLLPRLTFIQAAENMLSGTIPSTIYNLSSLTVLGVADNKLGGSLPPDMGITLPNLQAIYLAHNSFEGPIPASLHNASGLVFIDFPSNNFIGRVPSELGRLRGLFHLNLDANQMEAGDANGWDFLTALTNCSHLKFIGLYRNKLGGVLPDSIANLSTQLQWLVLGSNEISGSIPPGIENLVNLNTLGMLHNLFTGNVPEGIGKLKPLQILGLQGNRFVGRIPPTLGNLSQLIYLTLDHNSFEGPIPSSLGKLQRLLQLSLSDNRLNGSIPIEVMRLSSLSSLLDLSYNSLVGPLPAEVGNLKNLEDLRVSGNQLSGEIPGTLGNCDALSYLYMQSNSFNGTIPPSFSKLKGLQELDLSRNNLSGTIPMFLENFGSLDLLNLSYNLLDGEVPRNGVFKNATAVSLLGNDGLCGGAVEFHLPACLVESSKQRGKHLSLRLVIALVCTGLSLVLFSFFIAFRYWRRKPRKEAPPLPSLEEHPRVSYAELVKATDGFSSENLIGSGRYSSVYKGTLDSSNTTVAVKVFNLEERGSSKTFTAECEALRTIRHRSLIKILTSCSSMDYRGNDFKALVFEFMPNGSLETWLHREENGHHPSPRTLSLFQRLNIVVAVADALDYLHHDCQPPVVHCDLKPSNILLDNDMNAHVGDFGLAKFLYEATSKPLQDSSNSTAIKGTIGYVAPEYGAGCQVSTTGDVYSFGILLLEMFTGRRPVDEMFKDGLDLRTFVQMSSAPDRAMEIVDPVVMSQAEDSITVGQGRRGSDGRRIKECLVSLLRLGLVCSNQSPSERTRMRDVAAQVHAIRDVYLGAR